MSSGPRNVQHEHASCSRNQETLTHELRCLKSRYGDRARLKRRRTCGVASFFPLAVECSIEAPEEASKLDVDELVSRIDFERDEAISEGDSISSDASCFSPTLPRILNDTMTRIVDEKWKELLSCSRVWPVNDLMHWIRENFLPIVTSVPECLEDYMSVDECGATLRRVAIVDPPEVARQGKSKLTPAIQQELEMLGRRKNWELSWEEEEGGVKFQMMAVPVDPEWRIRKGDEPIPLCGRLPREYPRDSAELRCTIEEASLRKVIDLALESFGRSLALDKRTVCRLVQFLENHAGDILSLHDQMVQEVGTTVMQGKGDCTGKGMPVEKEVLAPVNKKPSMFHRSQGSLNGHAVRTTLKLEEIEMRGTCMLQYDSLAVLFLCSVCCAPHEVRFDRNNPSHRWECHKCKGQAEVSAEQTWVHDSSDTISILHSLGCLPQEVTFVSVSSTCSHCDGTTTVKVDSGRRTCFSCHECHAPGVVGYARCTFVGPRNRTKDAKKIHIQDGQPLPLHGTCKHYRRSKRWMRFPCCGRMYPCDVCHELGGHTERCQPDVRATRMACGFCSFEQAFSSRCTRCGSDLVATEKEKGNTRFWEGGKGCRDRSKLSRKDPKKYSGMSKTIKRK